MILYAYQMLLSCKDRKYDKLLLKLGSVLAKNPLVIIKQETKMYVHQVLLLCKSPQLHINIKYLFFGF